MAAWTPFQRTIVDAAILLVARRNRYFTADEVWKIIGDAVPITKAMAFRLIRAAQSGLCENTGNTIPTNRPAGEHNHGQRLSIWRSKVYAGS